MSRYFVMGKTHDLYGLLALALLSLVEVTVYHHDLWLVPLLVSVGVSVDLWAHCFHH